ncbi:MAG: hypothetical protein CMK09_04695 [Ponticaulis sp.]|nr:hypothetical protein [Ponticaulis sp.]|tara:strand:+ start:31012 stop:33393 length:2382 start_codon:yes stop_codon:yes gene_type:complete
MDFENAVSELFADSLEQPDATRETFIREKAPSEAVSRAVLRLLRTERLKTGFFSTGAAASSASAALKPDTEIGNWRILSLIGSGGMGEVYLAERADGHYQQTAALKRIAASDAEAWGRFSNERQVLAALEHPNISRLIDGGVHTDGHPYFVMEHIEGQTFSDFVRQHELKTKDICRLFLQVCDALKHAHSRLVLHRDVKPSNILVSEEGTLRLIDFGVAGLLNEADKDLNAPMTRAFAAPEQLAGQKPSAATDVFGLGITLYSLLTNSLPERVDGTLNLSAPGLSRDLVAILRKSTSESPADRYASVSDFQAELERYLTNYPVEAVGGGSGYLVSKFLARYPIASALAAGAVLALTGGIIGTSLMAYQADLARDDALQLAAEKDAALRRVQYSDAQSTSMRAVMTEIIGQALQEEELTTERFQTLLEEERDKAIELLESNPRRAVDRLYSLSEIFDERGDLRNVMATLEPIVTSDALRSSPFIVRSLTRYGIFKLFGGEYELAEDMLVRALKLANSDPELYAFDIQYVSAYLAETRGDPEAMEAAIGDINAFVDDLPLDTDANRNAAAMLLDQAGYMSIMVNSPAETIPILERTLAITEAVETVPQIPRRSILSNLTGQYMRAGQLEQADNAADALLELYSETTGRSTNMGLAYRLKGLISNQLGHHDTALDAFSQAEELLAEFDVENSDALFVTRLDLLVTRAHLGEPEMALAEMEKISGTVEMKVLVDAAGFFEGVYLHKLGEIYALADQPVQAKRTLADAITAIEADGRRPDLLLEMQKTMETYGLTDTE